MSQTQFSLSRLQLLLPSLFVLLQGIGGNEVFKVSGYLQKMVPSTPSHIENLENKRLKNSQTDR